MQEGSDFQKNMGYKTKMQMTLGITIKQNLLDMKAQMHPYTIIVGYFNTTFSPIDKSIIQKKGNFRIRRHYRSNGFNRHLQNIPPKSCIIHILFSI
jgi:hypothetical protein